MTDATPKKLKVLFLCTGNTARSQMAEALLRHHAGDRFEISSAGLEPGELHPCTVQVLQEKGLDTSVLHPKALTRFLGRENFHYLITVCSRAAENCPIFPGVSQRLAWPFEDPAAFLGSPEAKVAKFREVRDQIEERLVAWLHTESVSA